MISLGLPDHFHPAGQAQLPICLPLDKCLLNCCTNFFEVRPLVAVIVWIGWTHTQPLQYLLITRTTSAQYVASAVRESRKCEWHTSLSAKDTIITRIFYIWWMLSWIVQHQDLLAHHAKIFSFPVSSPSQFSRHPFPLLSPSQPLPPVNPRGR